MKEELKEIITPIQEDIKELKETQKQFLEVLTKYTKIEQQLIYDKEFGDEARKVIHKRIDKLEHDTIKAKDFMMKIIIGVASVALTTLLGILLGAIKI